MSVWLEPIRGKHPSIEQLAAEFAKELRPKPGKNPTKALIEIERQRNELIYKAERLRLKASALMLLSNEIKGA